MSKDVIWSKAGTTVFQGGETLLFLQKGVQDYSQANCCSPQKIIQVELLIETIMLKFFRYNFFRL